MKLKELLRTIPDDEYVCIGSQSGFVSLTFQWTRLAKPSS